jgi:hypothetical protein
MMATISQIPGELNIITTTHDDLSILLDFDIVLTSYTFEAKVDVSGTFYVITVTNTNLASGQITLSMLRTLLLTIPVSQHRWYLDWVTSGSLHRRILSGTFTLLE